MASGALPPGFPAIEIEGEHYWDGGLVFTAPRLRRVSCFSEFTRSKSNHYFVTGEVILHAGRIANGALERPRSRNRKHIQAHNRVNQ
jgi:predicted acylesterase/phospholipase RssA